MYLRTYYEVVGKHVVRRDTITMAEQRKLKRSYDVSFKLRAVESAEKSTKEAAARHFGVDARRIREWCAQKEKLISLKECGKSKRRRLDGGGRKAMDEDMEDALFSWVQDMRSRNLRVSRKMLRLRARDLSTSADFQASRGWLQRFMQRRKLSLRRKTTVCQTVPADCIPKPVSFVTHVRQLQLRHNYRHDSIFAIDETGCAFRHNY